MIARVLHVVPATADGIIPVFVERQIENLADLGYEPAVVQFRGDYISHNPRALASEVSGIRRDIRKSNPDLVHAHWGSLLAFTAGLATGPRTPFVVTFRGSDLNPVVTEKRSRRLVRTTFSKLAAARATAVVCVSDQLRNQIRVHRGDVQVIPDGLDTTIFFPQDRQAARRDLEWSPAEKVVFLYQGGRPIEKGRPLANDAVESLQAAGFPCRLEVLDSGASRDHVAKLLAASDCVLMLSDFEGSPNIVREALACGVPVVSVQVGDVSRWLKPETGSLIVDRDPTAVATAILQMFEADRPVPISTLLDSISESSSASMVADTYQSALSKGRRHHASRRALQ